MAAKAEGLGVGAAVMLVTKPPSEALMPPKTPAQPARADVQDGHPEQGHGRDEAELGHQRQAAIALDRPMHGQARGRGRPGSDLDWGWTTGGGGTGSNVLFAAGRAGSSSGGIVARRRNSGRPSCSC